MSSKNKMTFENQLETLEKIVHDLEKGALSLNDSLSQFEKGVKLTKKCQSILNEAEQKVLILSENESELSEFE